MIKAVTGKDKKNEKIWKIKLYPNYLTEKGFDFSLRNTISSTCYSDNITPLTM